MRVKQVKVAQALRGETSNILDDKKYNMTFDKGMLHIALKHNPSKIGPFIIFPANIAYLEYEETTLEAVKSSQVAVAEVVEPLVEVAKRVRTAKK